MPRKQRFKPSRKPKAVGTLTDLVPVERVDPATSSPSGVAADVPSHPEAVADSPPNELRGESS